MSVPVPHTLIPPMNAACRILDANLNRAREALRVLEDLARFGLGSESLAARLKGLRHDLTRAVSAAAVDPGSLLASRDAAADVGTAITTPGEATRPGPRSVAEAAGGRLGEALRSAEEAAKALGDGPLALALERVRYAGYDAAAAVTLAFGTGRARQWRLCVLITEALCRHHPWERVAELAMDGGADCLQLREKSLDGGELVRRARALVDLSRRRGVTVFVNDRADIAAAADADGVHLGQSDLSVRDVRALVGYRLLVGVSTETLDQAREAARAGADLCGVGPMFPTTTKEKPRLAGVEYLRGYLSDPETAPRPHLAIGGITPDTLPSLVAAGCRGVAVSAAVCGAADPRALCAALRGGFPPDAAA